MDDCRDIIVMGGSAGAIEPLKMIVETLRADLPAAVFVVQHLGRGHRSTLPAILDRVGPLPVAEAQDDVPLRAGEVRIAPADHHLLLERDRVRLRRGPPENRLRPAIDPLFRSAAANHGGRVVAVLLSGYLTDGAAGLRAVQRCGGLTIVQAPDDASVAEMPEYALANVDVDHVGPARRIGELLNDLAGHPVRPASEIPADIRLEARMAAGEALSISNENRLGTPSAFSCPDCDGNLWEIKDGRLLRFRCHVGHAYSGAALAAAQSEELDRALWSALRALRERAAMLRRLAADADASGRGLSVDRFSRSAAELEREAETLQRFICAQARDPREPSPDRAPG